ncbi:hypothetical protein AAG570_002889 [Ranatra chinensis]|uniref:Uncharacterized protein n=1 Tax=Ranatra chinensis TaxID=642074 RepID=A0ABD0Y6B3_9HEMI
MSRPHFGQVELKLRSPIARRKLISLSCSGFGGGIFLTPLTSLKRVNGPSAPVDDLSVNLLMSVHEGSIFHDPSGCLPEDDSRAGQNTVKETTAENKGTSCKHK